MGGFNSVLSAYLQQQQLAQRKKEAEMSHEQAQKQLDELHTYHQAEIDKMQQDLDLRHAVTAQQLRNTYIEHIAGGLEQPPENAIPTGQQTQFGAVRTPQTPPGEPSVTNLPTTPTTIQPTGITNKGYQQTLQPEDLAGMARFLSPSQRELNITSPEEIQRRQAAGEFATEAAKVAAQEPERASKEKIAGAGILERLSAAEQANEARKYVADQSRAGREHAADISGRARMYAAQLSAGSKVNAQELGDSATNVGLGVADLSPGANGIHEQSILRQKGWQPFGKKDGGDKLDSLNDLDGVIDDMRQVVPLLGTSIPGVIGTKIKAMIPGTEIKNRLAQIEGRSPQIVRGIMGIGSSRVTNTEIHAAMQAMINGSQTQDQANQNISKVQRDAYGRAFNDVMGHLPTSQKIAVMAGHGGLERWRNAYITTPDGRYLPTVKKQADGADSIWNPNIRDSKGRLGAYENIEDLK